MKIMHHSSIVGPGKLGKAEHFLEVTDDGTSQRHRLVCSMCDEEKIFPTSTAEKDSKVILEWISSHAHLN